MSTIEVMAEPEVSPFGSMADYEKFRETGEMPKADLAAEAPEAAKAEGTKSVGEAVGDDSSESEAKAGEDADDEKAEAGGKKRGGFQRKIERLQAEIDALKAGRPAEAEPAKPEPPADKPTLDKFESIEAYTEALTDWKLAKAEADRAAKAAAEQTASAWEKQLEAGRAAHEDFDDVIGSEIAITQVMRDTLLESEAGGELAYWLGSNPDEAARIARLSPIAQVRELAKQESKLVATEPPAKPQRRVTKAPEPITPVGARPASSTNGFRPEWTLHDYEAWRESGGGKR